MIIIPHNRVVFIEHIATAINTLSKLGVEKGEHIVIVGATVVGLILAQVSLNLPTSATFPFATV